MEVLSQLLSSKPDFWRTYSANAMSFPPRVFIKLHSISRSFIVGPDALGMQPSKRSPDHANPRSRVLRGRWPVSAPLSIRDGPSFRAGCIPKSVLFLSHEDTGRAQDWLTCWRWPSVFSSLLKGTFLFYYSSPTNSSQHGKRLSLTGIQEIF